MNSGFFYKTAADREKLVVAERKFVDDRVKQVIKLKQQVRTIFSMRKLRAGDLTVCLCFMIRCAMDTIGISLSSTRR